MAEIGNGDRYYLGDEEISLADYARAEAFQMRLKQYLELGSVSLLVGNGASIPLGSPTIWNMASIYSELCEPSYALHEKKEQNDAIALFEQLVQEPALRVGVEPFLATLSHFRAHYAVLGNETQISVHGKPVKAGAIESLERLIKKWLFAKCHSVGIKADHESLRYHRELLRRLLLRPGTLPRLKVFTTNYDLLIEKALDELGVHYFDGFVGTVQRSLRCESYNCDLYYPGDTTEGRVRRVDRVVQLHKLHGSINWRSRSDGRLDEVRIDHQKPDNDREYGEIMIYPSPLKLLEMNGYPYSEMFRRFASSITQPQSVLLTLGYSFADDHINRIIYQALSIPSFNLVIVVPEVAEPTDAGPGPQHEIWRLIHEVRSKRIMVVTGGKWEDGRGFTGGAGTLQGFAGQWLPDIREMGIEALIREEQARLRRPAVEANGNSSEVHV